MAAFLLVGHPPSRHPEAREEAVRANMQALGDALGLAPTPEQLPYIGHRVAMHGSRAALSVDRCDYRLGVSVGKRWRDFVIAGGPVVVALGLDPLARGADRPTIEAYLGHCTRAGRLLLGITEYVAPSELR